MIQDDANDPAQVIVRRSNDMIVVQRPMLAHVATRGAQTKIDSIADGNVLFSQGDVILGRDSSGAGGGMEIVCPAFGRTLISSASAVIARAALGLVIGTNVAAQASTLAGYGITDAYTRSQVDALLAGYEPLDPDLAAIAALGTTGYLKRTAINTWGLTPSVPFTDLSGMPTTLAGYGVQADADSRYLGIGSQASDSAQLLGNTWAVPGQIGLTTPNTGKFTTLNASGQITAPAGTVGAPAYSFATDPTTGMLRAGASVIGWAVGGTQYMTLQPGALNLTNDVVALRMGATSDTILARDGAGILAQRNGVNAQVFRLYNTYTDANNFERLNIQWSANLADISVQALIAGGAGTARNMQVGTQQAGTLTFYTNNTFRWLISAAGNFLASSDNANDIGTGGASRPRHVYIGSSIQLLAASAATNVLVNINGTHPASNVDTYGIGVQFTSPATSTTLQYGIFTNLKTSAAVYTVANMAHFQADSATLGAGSTVTNVRGFYAKNAIAIGTNNYGFYHDIAAATGTWGFYGSGGASNYFSGYVSMGGSPYTGNDIMLYLANGSAHRSTSAAIYGIDVNFTTPATATTSITHYYSAINTAAAAFTVGVAYHFLAASAALGSGSAISIMRAFGASNSTAVGANNYAFWTDFNDAPNTYAFYSAGTAASRFTGSLAIGTNNVSNTSEALRIVLPATVTAASVVPINLNFAAPGTTTTSMSSIFLTASTAAAAFTCPEINAYRVNQFTLGAGSTVSNLNAFYVNSLYTNDVAGTTVRGYYSLLNRGANANVYQAFFAGSATSYINGQVGFGTTNPSTAFGIHVVPSIYVTPTSSYAIGITGNIPTVATAFWGSIISQITVPTGMTASQVAHFRANSTAVSGTGVANAIYGFFADSTIAATGATSVYGFRGALTAATGSFNLYMDGTALNYLGGPLGILATPIDTFLYVGSANTMPFSLPTVYGIKCDYTAPSTATSSAFGLMMQVRTAAAAVTYSTVRHFSAEGVVLGSGSSVTTVYGYMARNSIAVGTNNYGYYSDINSAAATWQLAMSGTAVSGFGGPVHIGGFGLPNNLDVLLRIGSGPSTHPSSATQVYGAHVNFTAPSTATAAVHGIWANINTAAAAFTVASANCFIAATTSLGAGSAITVVRGFYASNGIAQGGTNYGFYSDLASATNTFQMYMAGTAASVFLGPVGILSAIPATGNTTVFNVGGTHPSTAGTIQGTNTNITAPSTATNVLYNYRSNAGTAAAAFTLPDLAHYAAVGTSLGAGSTITRTQGFWALAAIANDVAGCSSYGFRSDLNVGAAGTVWAFYGNGTAPSLFGGAIIEKENVETYGTTVTIDARLGNERVVTVTNTTAWTMAAPTNPSTGQYLEITIRNTSGGVMGAITWNAAFKMTTFTNPANGFSRTIIFRYNGTNWVEKGRTAADVPN